MLTVLLCLDQEGEAPNVRVSYQFSDEGIQTYDENKGRQGAPLSHTSLDRDFTLDHTIND